MGGFAGSQAAKIQYFDYYFDHHGFLERVDVAGCEEDDPSEITVAIREGDPRYVWYLKAHDDPPPDTEALDLLGSDLNEVSHREFYNADVWLFEARG